MLSQIHITWCETGDSLIKVGYNSKIMTRLSTVVVILSLIVPIAGCIDQGQSLHQQEALEIAWDTLKPNTESGNRDDWEIHDARKVYGKDIVNDFADMRFKNCPGPEVPENLPIKVSSEYWYIRVLPHPEVLRRDKSTSSAELVPVVPEPKINEAAFLIDPYSGKVIARRLVCK